MCAGTGLSLHATFGTSFGPLQPELRETRNGRIQVGATLRGSIVVTVRPRRFPVLHWPRPVG